MKFICPGPVGLNQKAGHCAGQVSGGRGREGGARGGGTVSGWFGRVRDQKQGEAREIAPTGKELVFPIAMAECNSWG